jgi:hypothetical protein
LAGVLDSFATAAEEVLPRMAGPRLSESTVQRTAEGVGREVGRRHGEGGVFGPARDWAWHKDAEGRSCAYVSIDATGVPQQGPGGSVAEGRMATVAMVYNPVPDSRGCWTDPAGKRPPWGRDTWPRSRGERRWPSPCDVRPPKWARTGHSGGSR